jgi:integrase
MNVNAFADLLWNQLEITPKTRSNYEGAYRRNLAPFIGNLSIPFVSKELLIEALAKLPQQTRYQTFMVAKVIFREAELRELVTSSPLLGMKTPKVHVPKQKFLTWEQLSEIDFGFHTKRIHFLALHGLRYGEAAALTIEDIHDGRVFINRSKWGKTKTESGVRSVPLMSEFVPFPLYQDRIRKALAPFGVTVHSLRKTFAYILKQSNVHITTAAKLMGHANPMVTMKVYTQVLDAEIDQSGDSIREFLKSRGGGGLTVAQISY